MKDEFITYFKSIEMESPLIEQAEKKYRIIESLRKSLGDCDIQDIFVEETINKDNKRDFMNIIFFLEKYFVELDIFSDNTEIRVHTINKNILGFNIDSKNYEWGEKANRNSMMQFFAQFSDTPWTLTASGENCDKLRSVIEKHVIPNLNDI